MKKPVNFRLSEENLELLNNTSKQFGFNQTEFLELILTLVRTEPETFAKILQKKFVDSVKKDK